jgi:hypothetical protein
MPSPARSVRSFFHPALTCTVARCATWMGGGDAARTVVQFGKFKGRTFEEARDACMDCGFE